jgi:phytoene dehydrogenase-like protein
MYSQVQSWDAICVGSGITSLAFAAQLVTEDPGKRVLVLEKHYVPGGYATWFRRKKLRFDCSLHKLSGVGQGGNLGRIFDALGLSQQLQFVYPSVFFAANDATGDYPLSNDYERYKAQLYADFPTERAGLDRFFEEVEVHGRNAYYQFQIMSGDFLPDMKELRYARKHLSRITVAEALDERIRDQRLKQILAAPGIYVGGFEEDLGYLYFLHIVFATLTCGNAYVAGTSQRLSNTLVARIRQKGSAVQLNTDVRRVLVDESHRVRGVETDRGVFYSDRVYLNASPHYALESLLPELECLNPVRQKLKSLKASWSTTTLYLATAVPPAELGLTHSETMFFSDRAAQASGMRRAGPLDEAASEDAFWRASQMEVTNYHKLDPACGHVVCLNVLDTMSHWPEYETERYQEKKQRATAALLGRLFDRKPAFRDAVLHQELSSPHTYHRYTNNFQGAGYGALVGTDASAHLFHYNFPIRGVHFLNAWVAGPSYEAAFGYAEMKVKTYRDDAVATERGAAE